ncbi:RnfH family protein [soil metagenome]
MSYIRKAEEHDPVASIRVQICYATQTDMRLHDLCVSKGTTLRQAIEQSHIQDNYPEIDLHHCVVGVFGKVKTLDSDLLPGDRVEIYRPLVADPMEARRRRASKQMGKSGY